MTNLVLATVMDAIAAAIVAAGLTERAFAWPVETAPVPCAMVAYPQTIEYDMTFGGTDEATFPVFFVVGPPQDLTTRDAVSDLIRGAASVKDVLDGTLDGAVSSLHVKDAQIDKVSMNGIAYVAVRFDCEVIS